MARLPRLVIPHQPHVVTQLGIGLQPVFRDNGDYLAYLGWLRDASRRFKVAIHAYALLPDRVHLLATPADEPGLGRMMQWIGRHYVPYFNARYQRAGTLWQGRYKATTVEPAQYLLACSLFIESSPVHAGLVAVPADYPWSSCAHHVGVRSDPLVIDHALYWALGNTPFDRELAYRNRLEQGLSDRQTQELAAAIQKAWPIGSDTFIASLAKQATRRVRPARRGRPPRQATAGVAPKPIA